MTINEPRIMRLDEVKQQTGLSRSTIYDHMKAGNFPKTIKLGTHSVGWVASEIHDWINLLIEARNTDTTAF